MESAPTTHTTAHVAAAPTATAESWAGSPLLGVFALVVLGALALVLARRRAPHTRRLEVVESLSLGPRRSLCLARVDSRLLVLGVSEAGVQLLSTHDAPLSLDAHEVPVSRDAFDRLLSQASAAHDTLPRAREVAP